MRYLLVIMLSLTLVGCGSSKEDKVEKTVAACWKKYEHNEAGLFQDMKCSNLVVMERIAKVGKNRSCGYRDLYNGEYNINDLSNLSAADQAYMKNVQDCTVKYRKHIDIDPKYPKLYNRQAMTTIEPMLVKDKKCNIPAVVSRVERLVEFGGPDYDIDKRCK